MKIRETFESIFAILVVAIVAICGLALARSCSRHDASQELAAQLRQARADRDSATTRAGRVRDSALQAISEQDAAWSLHVRDLNGMHQEELQEATRAAARRARAEVRARTGSAEGLFTEAPDTGSGRPPCEVTLTCSEAAAWQASDSLMRFQIDSSRAQERVSAASCSARVADAVVRQDSIHATRVFQQPRRLGAPFYVAAGAAVAELFLFAGMVLAQ